MIKDKNWLKYIRFIIVFLAFLLIITLYDFNNFLSIGIISLFLIINVSIFMLVSSNIFTGCRNVFGLLSVETLIYWLFLSFLKHSTFLDDHPKIDLTGIINSVIFSTGVSVFFFTLFLVINMGGSDNENE